MSKPALATFISRSEIEAQTRFEKFLGQLDCLNAKFADERTAWDELTNDHRVFCHGATWTGLVMIACAVMLNHWAAYALLFVVGFVMFITIAAKVSAHKAERQSHEVRLASLLRERDRLLNFGPMEN